MSVNPFVCQPLCQSTPLSVNPFVSQPLWLALPTVRIPRNRLTPDPSSQANATSSPRLPFPFPFLSPFSFLLSPFSFLLYPISFSFSFSLSLFPPASLGIVDLPVPVPVPVPVPPPPYPSTFWAQKRPFHSRLPLSRHFWLRIALFTPVCLLPVTSGSETSISLPFASFPSLLAQNRPFPDAFFVPAESFFVRPGTEMPFLFPWSPFSSVREQKCLFCSRGVLFRPSGNRERDGGPEKGWNGPGVRSGNEVRQKKV